ncbi:MAG TPA: heavy metal-binding domain-containing protein [Chthonomonadaceae bacterium]|nr:heavy metal-binding domain-containing protein [Chthonomonadaceae bacterium]
MPVMTGLSGNEMYCLHQKGLQAGDLVIGNSVFSVGVVGGIGSGLRTLAGGEVTQITSVIHDGRQQSYARMVAEAQRHGGIGITGVTNELIQHAGNVEFLSIGSCVHQEGRSEQLGFSSSADGQELYCQIDAGFRPIKFVFGNVAYSIGVGGGIMGALKSMARGEVVQYSQVFNETRHRALERITAECRAAGGNAVVGIKTSIIPFQGMQEMVMLGTASYHPALPEEYRQNPVSSDLTNEEMWNLVHMGYMPIQLVLGVSVYSLGLVGGITAAFKGLARGEISELTTLIYEARENAIAKIAQDATACGADDVVGIKTNVYQLGSGIIEFLAIGTAVKRIPGVQTASPTLPPQAIIRDKDTFINTAETAIGSNLNAATGRTSVSMSASSD